MIHVEYILSPSEHPHESLFYFNLQYICNKLIQKDENRKMRTKGSLFKQKIQILNHSYSDS